MKIKVEVESCYAPIIEELRPDAKKTNECWGAIFEIEINSLEEIRAIQKELDRDFVLYSEKDEGGADAMFFLGYYEG